MTKLVFHQVDVFTERRFYGNPLAVYLDADDLDQDLMQRIAREMNLSETTFVQRSDDRACAYRVRIFTPGQELPFAGHPTVGTAFVLDRLGRLPPNDFRFQMTVGPVRVHKEDGLFWMSPPAPLSGAAIEDLPGLAAALRLPARACLGARIVTNGVRFLCILLESAKSVDAVQMNRAQVAALNAEFTNVDILVLSYGSDRAYSRMFANPAYGIDEDPATGSSIAPLCLTLKMCGRLASSASSITVEQGTKMGRQSFLHARFTQSPDGLRDIEVGGTAVPVFESVLHV